MPNGRGEVKKFHWKKAPRGASWDKSWSEQPRFTNE